MLCPCGFSPVATLYRALLFQMSVFLFLSTTTCLFLSVFPPVPPAFSWTPLVFLHVGGCMSPPQPLTHSHTHSLSLSFSCRRCLQHSAFFSVCLLFCGQEGEHHCVCTATTLTPIHHLLRDEQHMHDFPPHTHTTPSPCSNFPPLRARSPGFVSGLWCVCICECL